MPTKYTREKFQQDLKNLHSLLSTKRTNKKLSQVGGKSKKSAKKSFWNKNKKGLVNGTQFTKAKGNTYYIFRQQYATDIPEIQEVLDILENN